MFMLYLNHDSNVASIEHSLNIELLILTRSLNPLPYNLNTALRIEK